MRLILMLLLAASLEGCAALPFDDSAFQTALPLRKAGYEHCDAAYGKSNFQSSYLMFDCIAKVERAFAIAIKLKRMDVYDGFERRIMEVAQLSDKDQISAEERNRRFIANRDGYFQTLRNMYVAAKQQNDQEYAEVGAGLSAFGAGYAQGQASSAAHRPVMCTTTVNQGIANTLC